MSIGGGNSNIFEIFTPNPGDDDPIWRAYFFKWVGEKPPTRCVWKIEMLDGLFLWTSFWGIIWSKVMAPFPQPSKLT